MVEKSRLRARPGRRVGSIAVALLLTFGVLGTTGCSAFIRFLRPTGAPTAAPTHPPHADSSKVDPETGDCWAVSFHQLQNDATWESEALVPCSEPHQSYTFAVVKLGTDITGSWQVSKTNDDLRDDVAEAAGTACFDAMSDVFKNLGWKMALLGNYFFVPPLEKWNAGDRDVRCDIAILAYGSKVASPELMDLPVDFADVEDVALNHPEMLDFCVDAPGSGARSGPLDTRGSTFANCTENPEWVLTDHTILPDDENAPFPTDAQWKKLVKEACKTASLPDDELWWSYFPQEDQWAAGDREIQCWFSPVSASA
jgi:Septum formation